MEQIFDLLSRKVDIVLSRYKLADDSVSVVIRDIRERLPKLHLADVEDLVQTVLTKIVEKLERGSNKSDENVVENITNYAAGVAHNACNDFIREKSPVRMRLKQNLRDLFAKSEELHCWKRGKLTLCGF